MLLKERLISRCGRKDFRTKRAGGWLVPVGLMHVVPVQQAPPTAVAKGRVPQPKRYREYIQRHAELKL